MNRTEGKATQFTSGNNDTFPTWSPDGKHIAFVSRRTLSKNEPGSELWIIDVNGGEAKLLLKMLGGISNVHWSTDGQSVIFISAVPMKQEEGEAKVVRGLPLYFDTMGFIYNFRRHLFTFNLVSKEVKQLTNGLMDVLYAEFSSKGDRIAYVAAKEELRTMSRTDIFIIPARGGEEQEITKSNMRIGSLSWSPDDRHIAFKGCNLKREYPSHDNVYVISADGQELRT